MMLSAQLRSSCAIHQWCICWGLLPAVAERSENGRGLHTADPTLHRVCYAVEPELVEGDTDCCEWRTGITCGFIPLLVRHGNSA